MAIGCRNNMQQGLLAFSNYKHTLPVCKRLSYSETTSQPLEDVQQRRRYIAC